MFFFYMQNREQLDNLFFLYKKARQSFKLLYVVHILFSSPFEYNYFK